MLNKFLILLFLSISMLLVSCNDDPTSLGEDLLPDQDKINVFYINSTDSSFRIKSRVYDTDTLDLGTAQKLYLGKHENVESTMLMKFYMFFPDSVRKKILADSLVLNSVTMEMQPVYTYGDENAFFDFSVHEILSQWNSLEFTKEDLPDLSYKQEDASSNHQFDDDSLITMDLDKKLVANWMKLAAEQNQETNYGLYFNYAPGTDKVLGFSAISMYNDSLLATLKLYLTDLATGLPDTMDIVVTSDVHVVLGQLPSNPSNNIILQGGIPIRSNLYFDIAKVPSIAIINRANLKLYLDKNESNFGSISSDYLRVFLLNDFETTEVSPKYGSIGLKLDSTKSYYSGEISPFVQEWLSNNNTGIKLSLYDDTESLNKVAIFGAEAADSLKPVLEIIYTSKN